MKDKMSETTGNNIVPGKSTESNALKQIDELETFLVSAWHALTRWHARCLNIAGIENGNTLDILVLRTIDGSRREKSPADICLALHIEDQHTVNYSLKKLARHDLVRRQKRGKMVFYTITEKGNKLCAQFLSFNIRFLVTAFELSKYEDHHIENPRKLLEAFAQMYTQASQQIILS